MGGSGPPRGTPFATGLPGIIFAFADNPAGPRGRADRRRQGWSRVRRAKFPFWSDRRPSNGLTAQVGFFYPAPEPACVGAAGLPTGDRAMGTRPDQPPKTMSTPTLRPLAAVVSLSVSTWAPAPAAQITWGEAFEVLQASDISNPPGASVVAALDFNNAAGWATGDDHVINGILFEQSASPMGVGEVSSLMASGSNYNATWYPNPTDDVDLDALLDSHAWHAGNPQETSITISGLTVGLNYQVQLIAVADSRGCCSARTYEPDDGTGNYGTGVTLQRGLFQSVLGTFTANADTQTILWRSLDSAAGNNDPGFSGLVVLEIDSEDTDGDGLFDTWEERYGLDPELSDTDGDMVPDDEEDGDNDGLDNGGEQSAGTDPTDPDTDGDGYEDGDENNTGTWTNDQATGTDPTNPDSDGDTLVDGVENPEQPFVDENQTGSDPNLVDTDADQLPDNVEVAIELDPNDPDTDGNGTPDGGEDEDMDGSPNAMELANGTGISDPDSDGDSLLDGVETNTGTFADATNTGTDPLLVDSDGDTIADGDEVEGSNGYRTNPNLADTDGDLVADGVEVEEGTDPTDPNSTSGDPDHFPDRRFARRRPDRPRGRRPRGADGSRATADGGDRVRLVLDLGQQRGVFPQPGVARGRRGRVRHLRQHGRIGRGEVVLWRGAAERHGGVRGAGFAHPLHHHFGQRRAASRPPGLGDLRVGRRGHVRADLRPDGRCPDLDRKEPDGPYRPSWRITRLPVHPL